MRGEWREFSDRSGWLAILIPICALGLAFGPDQFPLVTIRAFLIPMAALLVGLATWMLKKHYLYMGISTIFAACLVLVPPARVFLQAKDKVRSTSLWTIAQMNVHEPNTSFAQVVATARATGADLLSMQEIDTTWRKRLDAGLSDLYPWHIHGAGERNYGIALYSNMPLEGWSWKDCRPFGPWWSSELLSGPRCTSPSTGKCGKVVPAQYPMELTGRAGPES